MIRISSKLPIHEAQELGREKILSLVKVTDRGCWEWTGYVHSTGYGYMYWRNRPWSVHRLAFTLFNGVIPRGLSVCHACDNRACVNPDHLFLGDQRINVLDMVVKGRNRPGRVKKGQKRPSKDSRFCMRGHEFTPENTHIRPNGRRRCRACHVIYVRRHNERLRAAVEATAAREER